MGKRSALDDLKSKRRMTLALGVYRRTLLDGFDFEGLRMLLVFFGFREFVEGGRGRGYLVSAGELGI